VKNERNPGIGRAKTRLRKAYVAAKLSGRLRPKERARQSEATAASARRWLANFLEADRAGFEPHRGVISSSDMPDPAPPGSSPELLELLNS
jgi:hypothetical protein